MSRLSITFSVADQNFAQTKSLGILNLSVQVLEFLARRPELAKLNILSNSTLDPRLQNLPARSLSRHDIAIRGKLGRIYWDQLGVYNAAKKLRNDWLYLPKGFASFLRPSPVKLATCVADANHDYYKQHFPTAVPWLERTYFDLSFRATLKHADIIFTISDFTNSETARVARGYDIKAPPIKTIGIGFFPKPPPPAKKNRILVLAGRWPHKRTDLALEFLDRFQQRTSFPGTIEWVGSLPPGAVFPARNRWILHKRMADPEFERLLSEAQALVYFSDYEGFGMPPVESAIAGTCPVYSDIPVTREIMAAAGFSFHNTSYESFEAALNRALKTSVETNRQWGEQLLARHNWELVAERIVTGLLSVESGAFQKQNIDQTPTLSQVVTK